MNDVAGLEQYFKKHDVNEETNGQSLLYWAVFHNRLNIVQKLIELGADVNYKDSHERTPLSISIFFNFVGITKQLLNNNAIVKPEYIDKAYRGWNGKVQEETINLLREYGWLSIYLDDLRDIPSGFVGAKKMEEAIELLMKYNVHILSLDHDLGMDGKGNLLRTGYDLVKYICENVKRPANKIYLHTDNIVGRDNMFQTLMAARRRRFIDEDIMIYPYPFVKNRYSGFIDYER